jgi:hypothetical protein
MAGIGFHSVVAKRAHIFTADLGNRSIWAADCQEENERSRIAIVKSQI